jgi:hypothetical protein
VFSHSQTVVVCPSCNTVLCVPTGGKARLTEGALRQGRRGAGSRSCGAQCWHGASCLSSGLLSIDRRSGHQGRGLSGGTNWAGSVWASRGLEAAARDGAKQCWPAEDHTAALMWGPCDVHAALLPCCCRLLLPPEGRLSPSPARAVCHGSGQPSSGTRTSLGSSAMRGTSCRWVRSAAARAP